MSIFNNGFMAQIDLNLANLAKNYFNSPENTSHKQYEVIRAFFYEGISATSIAKKYGYSVNSVYSLVKDFKSTLKTGIKEDPFFKTNKIGRKKMDGSDKYTETIVTLRKQYLSVPDIKSITDSLKINISERYIYNIIKKEGFARLPRRDKKFKLESQSNAKEKIAAPKSEAMDFKSEIFNSQNVGILCFLPFIKRYGIDKIITESSYPQTSKINRLSSILSFLSLKLSDIRRYNADDIWCMDKGMGLFAGVNVLPKTAWFSSYSSRVTRSMNQNFLKKLHNVWVNNNLLSDTINLDFTTIPYWGDTDHLENNWSGKRHTTLSSLSAVLAQDPDSGIIDYDVQGWTNATVARRSRSGGDTNIRHNNSSNVVLEFLDFYSLDKQKNKNLKYLVFDSKFTTYPKLKELDERNIKFLTIRRRGKKIVEKINNLSSDKWRKIHVMNADGKGRSIKVYDEKVNIKDYGKTIRQIAITGHGKIKPALIITNDFNIKVEDVVRKYSRRWIVEKGISEQIEFFHLNRLSSSIVIKVDFDFTMTIFAHNLYRIFASNLEGYSHQTAKTIFDKFIYNSGEVEITPKTIEVKLKKKRHLPILLTEMQKFNNQEIPWFENRKLIFSGATTS